MAEMKRAAGYVKLAKLWERSKASAMVYHRHYFQEVLTQTRAYLAANHEELCFLLYFLFELPVRIDIVTDDDDIYRIDTIKNVENQREALHQMARSRVSLMPEVYKSWHSKVIDGMNKLVL